MPAEAPISPPFLGSALLEADQIPLEEVVAYLDRQALFAGQWQMRKGKDQSREAYEQDLASKAEPVLQSWLTRIRDEGLLQPAVAYGYFPCGRSENGVEVFDAAGARRLGRFELPRQRGGNRYCIADFYNDLVNDGPSDVLPMQAVTMGEVASQFSQSLFAADAYSCLLYTSDAADE